MTKFAYNNVKNASINHTLLKLNCDFYPRASYKENANPQSQSKSVSELAIKLRERMVTCRENLQYTQKLQK